MLSNNFVETSARRKLIDKNDLSAVLNHAVTGKACKCEDDILWITLEHAVKLGVNGEAFLHCWIQKNFHFGVFKAVLSCKHLENFAILFDSV